MIRESVLPSRIYLDKYPHVGDSSTVSCSKEVLSQI